MDNLNKLQRETSVDIIKIVGCISVIMLHYTEYYYGYDDFGRYILLNSFRWFVFGCIGLYILSTGYLNCYKKIESKYYLKLFSIVVTFLCYSILSHIIISPYDGTVTRGQYLWNGIKWYFWGFHGYYWYMNFYIAFFLMIPFINVMINNLEKRQHQMLIMVSIITISLPEFISILGDFWQPLKESGITLPSYFSMSCFPFIYYFIGSYLRKYVDRVKIKQKMICFILIMGTLILHSILDWLYLKKYQNQFEIGQHVYSFNSYGNLFTILSCTCFFLILKGVNVKEGIIKKMVAFLSSHTLEMYLGLMIADKVLNIFCDKINFAINCSLSGFVMWTLGELSIVLFLAVLFNLCKSIIKLIIKWGANWLHPTNNLE